MGICCHIPLCFATLIGLYLASLILDVAISDWTFEYGSRGLFFSQPIVFELRRNSKSDWRNHDEISLLFDRDWFKWLELPGEVFGSFYPK